MSNYSAKHISTEAVQNDGTEETVGKILNWINGDDGDSEAAIFSNGQHNVVILSAETGRNTRAIPGDYVVRAAEGEYFVMQARQFEAMFRED